jgi:hypothetical protein
MSLQVNLDRALKIIEQEEKNPSLTQAKPWINLSKLAGNNTKMSFSLLAGYFPFWTRQKVTGWCNLTHFSA